MSIKRKGGCAMRKNACCFTGHREIPPEDREPLRTALLSEIQRLYAEKGVTEFYTGGARGFDTMAAEAVLKIREALPVRLHLILYELVQIGAAAFI